MASEEEVEKSVSPEATDDADRQMRRRKRGYLRMYYGVTDEGTGGASAREPANPLDIDSSGFKVDQYMEKMLRNLSLTDLYDKERKVKKETLQLDSNMQHLVYENHSKFIKASETIKEMKDDFQRLEDGMSKLSSRIEGIRSSSNSINEALSERKQQIAKLSSVHHLLKKLQFLFELPGRLNKCLERRAYSQAVNYYVKAQKVLEQYKHLPSFHGIQHDCLAIIDELKTLLKGRLDDQQSSPKMIAEAVDLLLQLQEPPQALCQQYLDNSRRQLESDLLKVETAAKTLPSSTGNDEEDGVVVDAVEFVGVVCNGFLGNMSLIIQSCFDMFIRKKSVCHSTDVAVVSKEALVVFVQELMSRCSSLINDKLTLEAKMLNSAHLARALDRLSGKLHTLDQLLPSAGIYSNCQSMIKMVVHIHTESHAHCLLQNFSSTVTDIRQEIATFKGATPSSTPPLSDHSTALYAAIKTGLDSSLTNLLEFISPDINFTMQDGFRKEFCLKCVRQEVVVDFLNSVIRVCKEFTESSRETVTSYPPSLILILAGVMHQLERSHISYLVSYADEKFSPFEKGKNPATPIDSIVTEAKTTAELLINHYVRMQGQVLAQMIRKSVETRDWLNTIEPRNVRSVMRRMVEEVTVIDKQVGLLFEEGFRKSDGSETSRTFTYSVTKGGNGGYPYSSSHSGLGDSSLLSNIQKLFFEKIEVFGNVEFTKLSIVTGVIKIALKALVECVRLRTFGKYGLQQMQVDAHYLQIYLWRYVSDEQLVRVLLDEVISSTIGRCRDPVLMEQSVVELICENS
ncbi:PREDICTED: vacuolar protein sorting-associated protein 51 homolog [Amphimedon queenslandica]|uniref:Vacuolar protein sorting-associated protein 51 homolog n=1 Tax=Amphimedon queenslandica TaxID=400682 RepID=A0A1X7VF26_AMPQE|nr:PREDICTED: vacuolar protein sorting-associated protein 51 homolog [Amphimedon queenslandica]|eukprot:XP_019849380.1 PREDICTED: vacuolar protein sorting-associated protein 51 homolog [Amphimedon queenslandica]